MIQESFLRQRFRGPIYAVACALVLAGCGSSAVLASESERIAEVMRLRPGLLVADVGAGDGEWTVDIARRVGSDGHVWATEIADEELEDIRRRVESEGLGNVTVVRGDQTTTGLPDACCDAILLRLVYHHFTDPPRMRADLRRALRPGGVLAVVDIEPQENWRKLEGVPERGGHGIPAEDLVRELTADGFREVRRLEDWNDDPDRYCVVFRRGAGER